MVSSIIGNNPLWKQLILKNVTNKIGSGKTPLGGASSYKLTGIALIRSQNIRNDSVDLSDVVYIDEKTDQSMSNTYVYKNDVLLNITGASIGRCAVYKENVHANVNQHVCIIRPIETVNPDFLQLLLASNYGQKQILSYQAGGGREGLNFKQIGKMSFYFPPLNEQNVIVASLLDLNNLITNLEKLIEKKKNIRQGTLRQLMTGSRRIPGFVGEWKSVNLSKTAQIKARIGWQGLTTAEYLDDGYSLLVTGTDFEKGQIKWETCHFVTKSRFDQDSYIQLRNGDVLITKDGTIGKIAIVEGLNKPATLNSGVFVVRPLSGEYTERFLYYVLMSNVFRKFINELMAGSTITHLYQKDLIKFNFYVPPTKEEQDAIVEVLCNMDKDINRAEVLLSKYKMIKAGMMQKLLSGEIRLI